MALSFDDLPDEAPQAKPAAPSAQGGLSFDDLPDEVQVKSVPIAQPPKPGITGLLEGHPLAQQQSGLDPMEIYRGAARRVDQGGLAIGRILGIPAAQTFDAARGLFTDEDPYMAQNALREHVLAPLQRRADSLAPAPNASFGNKMLNAGGGLGGDLLMMLATGGLSRAAPALPAMAPTSPLPAVAGQLGQAARTMAAPAGINAINTGHDVTAETGSVPEGLRAAAVTGAGDIAMGLLPAALPGNLAMRVATGAPIGVATGEASRQIRNAVVPSNMQAPFSAEGALMNAVMGGAVGGVLGRAPEPRFPQNAPEQPAAPTAPIQQAQGPADTQGLHAQVMAAVQAQQQAKAAPTTVPRAFAGSQDVVPLFRSMGMDQQQMESSLALLRPDEPNIEAARRGKMTWEETSQLADLAGTSIAKMKARRLGQPLNAEDHLAATRLLQQQTTRTLDLANRMSELSSAGKTDESVGADFMLALNDLRTAQSAVMGSRAELGRALNVQRMNVETGRRATALLEAVGGIDKASDMANALVNAARSGGVKSANKLASKAGSDMFWTMYKSALLSGPDTHIVNSASNLANALLNTQTRGVAGVIGSAKRSVGLQGETYMAEPVYQLRGFVDGIGSGVRAFADSWNGRETEYEISTNAKNDVYRSDFLGQKYWGVPLRALGAADAFFKSINAGMETYSLAYRTAASEGLEGDALGARVKDLVANPTDKMKEGARAAAEFQTFTDKSGAVINMLNGAKNRTPLGLGNIPAPFVKTPGKIMGFSVKHTPLLTYLFEDSRKAFGTGGAAHEQVLARQAIGTLAYTFGAMGAAAGFLTGAGPQDEERRRAWLAAGNQPLSIKINGEWYSYARIEPFATLFGISADVYQNYQDGDTTAAAFTKAISGNFLSKTWLQGLSKAVQAIADPDRYGAGWVNSTGATLANPWTIGAQAARIGDDYQRQADYKSFTDQLKYRTPFLRESLPIKLDHFGAPMEENERQWHGFGPITRSKPSDDPVRIEASRLGWAPGRQQDYFSYKGQRRDMTPEQVYERNQVTGQMIHRAATKLMRSTAWQRMDDDQRRETLDKLTSRVRSAVKVAMIPWVVAGKRGPLDRLKSSNNIEVSKK